MLPISGPHRYDSFKMPWVQAIILFRMLLINRLVIRQKKRYIDVCHLLDKALFSYNEVIYKELMDILNEAKQMTDGKGIPIAMNRNPSQYRGSIILVYCDTIKVDPFDFTSEYSPLLCASLNADFDGDEHNMTVAMDMETYLELKNFEIHYSAFNSNKPYGVAKALSTTDTVVINVSSYLQYTNQNPAPSYISPELAGVLYGS